MQKVFTLLLISFIFKNISNQCLTSFKDLLIEGKDPETLANEGKKIGDNIYKLNTKRPLYFYIPESDNNGEEVKNFALLKKLTDSYGNEKKPFTSFFACVHEDEKNLLVFENLANPLDSQAGAAEFENIKQKGNKALLKFTSDIFVMQQRLSDLNIVPANIYESLAVLDEKPFFNFIDSLREQQTKGNEIFTAPEGHKDNLIYSKSLTYSTTLFANILLKDVDMKEAFELFKQNITEEGNQLAVNKLNEQINSHFKFTQPNIFVKFLNSIVSIFKDNRVQRAYDLSSFNKLGLSFNMKDRPRDSDMAAQLVTLSNNLVETVQIDNGSDKIIL
jgi:hypothetical protein